MRHLLIQLITATLFLLIFSSPISATTEKESIIIEVEGNPKAHQAYLETYYPFIDVIATYDQLFNGLALQATADKLSKIASLEFITAVHPVQKYQGLSTSTIDTTIIPDEKSPDVNLVFPSALNTTKFTGKGVKVGVIDTGMDFNHPDLVANYVGGYDLVDLDDDPMETEASEGMPTIHGTHVAGIIAANGDVQGVAPDADIYAYRALGPGGIGSSVHVIAAMEQAVKDGVDLINLSLGNLVNGPDYPTSMAVNRAVELGTAVVIANGNNGPENWTVGSPAAASKALSVGASSSPKKVPFLYIGLTDKEIPITTMMGSLPWTLEKDYQVVHTGEKEHADINGKIVLIERSDIPFHDLAKKAEQEGARAVLIYNNEQGDLQGAIENEGDPVTIPVAGISEQDGKGLVEQLQTNPLYIDTKYKQAKTGIAPFSSRGPVTINWHIKPDILAPGVDVLSTIPGGYQVLQGTSMAAPHVSGAMALVKEAHPKWSNEQIIGALKTTASRIKGEEGAFIDPISQGMGQIQVQKAINTKTIIHNPLLAFGKLDGYSKTNTIELTIENTTNKKQEYDFDIPKKQRGLVWNLPQSFTLNKNETRTFFIELHVVTPLVEEAIHQGWLTLNQADDKYHLPYLFVNKTADYPKAMGFEFSLKPFSKDMYEYQIYVTDAVKSMQVNLYDPDTLIYEDTLLKLTDLKIGMNKGHIKKSSLGKAGHYKAIITVQLESGEYDSHETEVFIK